jgi:hypothetical protein
MTHPVTLAASLALAAALGAVGLAKAQSGTSPAPEAPRTAPPEVDRSRPDGDPTAPSRDRSGSGPTGNDIVEDRQGDGVARGVIRPPMSLDPGIQGKVPNPTPRTTPVIPPPGTPGGDPSIIPR